MTWQPLKALKLETARGGGWGRGLWSDGNNPSICMELPVCEAHITSPHFSCSSKMQQGGCSPLLCKEAGV